MGWNDDDTVPVALRLLGGRTDKAVQVVLADDFGTDEEGVWLPLSQIESIETEADGLWGDVEEALDSLDQGDSAEFEVREWLAEREGWA